MSLIRVLVLSPRADLDLILLHFLARRGDADGVTLLPSSASCALVTVLIEFKMLCQLETKLDPVSCSLTFKYQLQLKVVRFNTITHLVLLHCRVTSFVYVEALVMVQLPCRHHYHQDSSLHPSSSCCRC